MNKMIISDFYTGYTLGFEFHEDKPVRIHVFDKNNILGNIYCGYVKDVKKDINAAFVTLDGDRKGYLSLKNCPETVKIGNKILVQVSVDKIKGKDYSLTCNINLKSEDLILTFGTSGITISKKIKDQSVRDRLKSYLLDYEGCEYGFIMRTSAKESDEHSIKEQAENLVNRWNDINKKYTFTKGGSLIYNCNNAVEVCRDYKKREKGDIITDSEWIYNELCSADVKAQYYFGEKISLCNLYSLETHLKRVTCKKVQMKSGGYIVIEPTEALTVIDVNTGKAKYKNSRNETFKKINKEALEVIMQQIRLRNLSGIIIMDFINMACVDDYDALEAEAKALAKSDFCTCTIEGFTKLGLMEITRMKREKPLHEILNYPEN